MEDTVGLEAEPTITVTTHDRYRIFEAADGEPEAEQLDPEPDNA